ncbi:putative ATP-dependent Lon protease [Vibrio maritimus]|uniref:Putative ATP-dependent Lon protease n=1 Tax=Vibrio maritimus TaxID=990268 RepID=A0A090TB29_9VIBR|nr:putative ATP-dependent Lon protease [Vibrio maritimus]
MRFRLPAKVLQEVLMAGKMAKRRTVIRYHYGHSVAPNTPSDIIAVG